MSAKHPGDPAFVPNVLYLDHRPDQVEILRTTAAQTSPADGFPALKITMAADVATAYALCQTQRFDVLLIALPILGAPSSFDAMRACFPPDSGPPIIVLAPPDQAVDAQRIVREGAVAYLLDSEVTSRLAFQVIFDAASFARHMDHSMRARIDRLLADVVMYRSFIRSHPDGAVILFDHDTRIVMLDGPALENIGVFPRDYEGKRMDELGHPRYVALQESFMLALQGKLSLMETAFGGRTFNVQMRPVHDETGQVMLGALILQDVTERKRAARNLERRRELEQIIAAFSTDISTCDYTEVDAVIDRHLGIVGRFAQVDRVDIFQADPEQDFTVCTHEWHTPDTMSLRGFGRDYRLADHPWWMEHSLRREPIQITDVDSMGPDAAAEQAIFRAVGLRAALVMPIFSGAQYSGHMGFGSTSTPRRWDDDEITLLRFCSHIVSGALSRKSVFERLMALEVRFRSLMSQVPMLVFEIDTASKLIFAAGNGLELLGVDARQIIGEPFTGFRAGDSQVMDNVQAALAGKTYADLVHVPSRGLYFETWYLPRRDEDGRVFGALGVAVDVTERELARSAESEQRSLAEALRDTAAALNSTLDTNIIMAQILESVGKVVPSDSVNIILFDDQGAYVAYSQANAPVGRDFAAQNIRFSPDTPNLHRMRTTGKPILIQDVRMPGTEWINLPAGQWIRAYLGIPIKVGAEVIGTLNLDSAMPGFFTEQHVLRLQAFADQVVAALRNAQLFERVRRNAEQLAVLYRTTAFLNTSLASARSVEDIRQQIITTIRAELGSVTCQLYLVADDGMTLEAATPNTSLLQDALQQEQAIYIPDVNFEPDYVRESAHTRSVLCIPLITPQGGVGVIQIGSPRLNAFSEQERRVLLAFCERAATAIQNFQLYEAQRRYTAELELRVQERTSALEAERSQLNAILESMGEGVMYGIMGNGRLIVRYVNQTLGAMFGYSAEEIMVMANFISVLDDPERLSIMTTESLQAMRQHGVWRSEFHFHRRDGRQFDGYVSITLIRWVSDTEYEGVVLVRDISQEKALQEQKDRFIANASHELRTPLTNFKMRLYLARRQPERLADHLSVLESTANRMQHLVDDLLDVSRFERGVVELNAEEFSLQDVLAETVETQRPHADEKRLTLICTFPEQAVRVRADMSRIGQVITNVLVNAINYTDEGGSVTVTLDLAQREVPVAVIMVQDTGIGIPPEQIEHIFEPFFRTKHGNVRGTGLGLAITREIVHLHGGEISVQSRPQEGTTLRVTLPALP